MTNQGYFGYHLSVTEHERGWGSKPDGYMVFLTEEAAIEFLRNEYANRNGVVPDYYLSYAKSGWKPITKGLYDQIVGTEGCVWID